MYKRQVENEALRSQAQTEADRREAQEIELTAQRKRIADLETQQQAAAGAARERKRRRRLAGGSLLALVSVVAGSIALATGTVTGSFGFAIVVFISILLALAALGWGLSKPLRWSWNVVIGIGAFSALFFSIYGVAQAFLP